MFEYLLWFIFYFSTLICQFSCFFFSILLPADSDSIHLLVHAIWQEIFSFWSYWKTACFEIIIIQCHNIGCFDVIVIVMDFLVGLKMCPIEFTTSTLCTLVLFLWHSQKYALRHFISFWKHFVNYFISSFSCYSTQDHR